MKPKVLLCTTCRWLFAARLAVALNRNGGSVDIVCPREHPATRISSVGTVYPYRSFSPLRSFRFAILSSAPNLIIPCDDLARAHLLQLYRQEELSSSADRSLLSLLELSIGNQTARAAGASRDCIIRLAREEGLPVPDSTPIFSPEELKLWSGQHGFPVVVKSDGTSGGTGVHIVRNEAIAERSFASLNASPSMLRAIKRALFDRDCSLLRAALSRRRTAVSAQTYIDGSDATMSVACWRGRVVASISMEVLEVLHPKGPASVVRLRRCPIMHSVAERMVLRLGLSGLYGFDFVLQRGTGQPILIEMNLRATPTAHLQLGSQRDLPAALIAAIMGCEVPHTTPATNNACIAVFPTEWKRDPMSPWLRSAFHDVPWEEPSLICASLKNHAHAFESVQLGGVPCGAIPHSSDCGMDHQCSTPIANSLY